MDTFFTSNSHLTDLVARYKQFLVKFLDFSFHKGKCDYVECKYTEWTNWNPACGKNMERKRTLQTIQKTVEKASCDGLTKTCTGDAEQVEKKDELCEIIFYVDDFFKP